MESEEELVLFKEVRMVIRPLAFPTFPIGFSEKKLSYLKDLLTKYYRNTDLIVLPELFTIGYPPNDLLYSTYVHDLQDDFITDISELSTRFRIAILFGGFYTEDGKLYNVAYLALPHKPPMVVAKKMYLPNYNIFNEKRYFQSSNHLSMIKLEDQSSHETYNIGVVICEDIWVPSVTESLVADGAHAIISINASPYTKEKSKFTIGMLKHKAKLYSVPIIYSNWYGGQDEIIYVTPSVVINENGLLQDSLVINTSYKKQLEVKRLREKRITELTQSYPVYRTYVGLDSKVSPDNEKVQTIQINEEPKLKDVLALGINSYFRHNKLRTAILGLSGGIDSAVVLGLLIHALKDENSPIKQVKAYFLPSIFTTEDSYTAINLLKEYIEKKGVEDRVTIHVYKLENLVNVDVINEMLKRFPDFVKDSKLAKQNLQARLRGLFLSTISNAIPGSLVIACGNKSEYAMGYATLYGDMVGGLAPLKDIWKTEVYELAKDLDIPEFIINRRPSAELDEDQIDEADLGVTYENLDVNLKRIVEDVDLSNPYAAKVLSQEFKRRQGPLGFKVSNFSFEDDRKFPISVNLI